MLAKLTAKNQITLPKRALELLGAQPAPPISRLRWKMGASCLPRLM